MRHPSDKSYLGRRLALQRERSSLVKHRTVVGHLSGVPLDTHDGGRLDPPSLLAPQSDDPVVLKCVPVHERRCDLPSVPLFYCQDFLRSEHLIVYR